MVLADTGSGSVDERVCGGKEDVHVVMEEMMSAGEPEILDELPEGLNGADTLEQLMEKFEAKDRKLSEQTPLGIVYNSVVNEEFMEISFCLQSDETKCQWLLSWKCTDRSSVQEGWSWE